MQPWNERDSVGGFTLVEVLLALMLFSLSAVVLGAAYLNVLNSYELVRRSETLEKDLRFIRAQILQTADLETIERGGEMESFYLGRVHWRVFLETTPTPDLFLATVEIEYRGAEAGRQTTQTFYLFRPNWSDPAERNRIREEMQARFEAFREFQRR